MFPTASLTAFLVLAVSVAVKPIVVRKSPISLTAARHLNITGAQDVILKDQARAKNLVSVSKESAAPTQSAVSARLTSASFTKLASALVNPTRRV
jgi:hypothetical protein